jgi:hypothetical protein
MVMTGKSSVGKMSIGIRPSASTAVAASAITPAMTVTGWRCAKTIGFIEEFIG